MMMTVFIQIDLSEAVLYFVGAKLCSMSVHSLTTASRYPRQYVSLMIKITDRADRHKCAVSSTGQRNTILT
jgi:hypothetical protein